MAGPPDSIFGPIVDESDVERALLAHLEKWMPTYLPYVVRARDPDGTLYPDAAPEVRNYTWRDVVGEKFPEDQLPMMLARGIGEYDDPGTEGDGVVNTRYVIYLIAVCSGFDRDEAREAARIFASAAQLAIMQHEDLGGFAAGVAMSQGGRYPITAGGEGDRFLSGVYRPYIVEVAETMRTSAGPLEPLEDPSVEPEPWPTVKEGGGSAAVESLRRNGFWDEETAREQAEGEAE